MTDPMYIKLGTQVLTGKVYEDIKFSGGFFDIKQDGATSLRTGARKGDPKGLSVSFSVCFETEALASAFLAYVAPYSPEDPDFDEEVGAEIDLFLRTADWKYRVWGVVVKPAALGKSPMDYLQYCYEVVCYLYSPYSEAASAQDLGTTLNTQIAGSGDATAIGQHGANTVHYIRFLVLTTGRLNYLHVKCSGSGNAKFAIYVDSAGEPGGLYAYSNTPIALAAGWNIVAFPDTYFIQGSYNWLGFNTDAAIISYAATPATRQGRYKAATYSSWTWPASAGSGFTSAYMPTLVEWWWDAYLLSNNANGHIAVAPDPIITASYSGGRAAAVTLELEDIDLTDSETLVLADQANSAETWELIGNENKLLQTYEDAITAGTQWGRDWVGSGTFDTDHIELNNAQAAYIRLSGPHQIKKPIKMTADLSLDSGGATGEATVDISPDGVAWETVLDQDDFETGSAEYALPATYMTDVYVRIKCTSGTSGKYVNIGSIKFEVERWIEDGAVPVVAAGVSKVLTVSATGGAIAVDGSFKPRRKFL